MKFSDFTMEVENSFIKGAGGGVRGDVIPEGVLFGKLMFIPLTVLIFCMQGLTPVTSGDWRLPKSGNAWAIYNSTSPSTASLTTRMESRHPERLDGEGVFNPLCSPL